MRQLTGASGSKAAQATDCDLATAFQSTSKRADNVGPNMLRYLR
jgi:hypothetical protein